MFKNSYLGILKSHFLSLCPFRTENPLQCQFYPNSKTIPYPKRRGFSLGVRGKIDIALGFFVRNGQSERKPNFDTPK
jgi:hypothetical protein